MRQHHLCHLAIAAIAFTAMGVVPALADRIDGDWCNGPASFHIDGTAIRTPGGKTLTGDYSRHAFHYIAADGETDAGADIMMRLVNETTVEVWHRVASSDGPVATWKRCQPVS